MENRNLLQEIGYLKHKVVVFKEDSVAKKTADMYNNYIPKRPNKYWHSQRKIDNRSKALTFQSQPPISHASKYRYKKPSNPVAISPSARSSELLSVGKSVSRSPNRLPEIITVRPPSAKMVQSNMHINPHFQPSRNADLSHQNVNAHGLGLSKTLELAKQAVGSTTIPTQNTVPKTSVHVNRSLFDSDKTSYSNSVLSSKLPAIGVSAVTVKKPLEVSRSIHVNPVVLSSRNDTPISAANAMKSVHVNPKKFAQLKSEVCKEKPCPKPTPALKISTESGLLDNFGNRSLVALSRTKLVRCRKLNLDRSQYNQNVVTPKSRLLSTSKYVPSPLTKIVKSVRSKYKYVRKTSATPSRLLRSSRGMVPFERAQYKLDRRQQKTPKRLKKVHKYSVKYENSKQGSPESNLQGIMQYKRQSSSSKSPFGNRVWGNTGSLRPKRVIITDRKLLKIGSTPVVKRRTSQATCSTVGSTLVRIGGILYKTSRTQLTRTNGLRLESATSVPPKTMSAKRPKCGAGHIVHVRGNRFLMDRSGKTLRRFSNDSPTANERLKRVDIGGATFIQKTPNVLIRTNTHNIRSMLSHVKQKSIALLTKQMRKNNTICKFYRRFGRCFRYEKGRCPCVHDKKYVAICKSFLLGQCKADGCLYSHELIPEKMPTCKYYLQACCGRDICPYVHRKLDVKAPLCLGYLQGYCNDGLNCRKWHFYICPQFDKTGKCSKGKYCPFPHKPRKHMELSLDHLAVNVEHIMTTYMDRQKAQKERKSNPEKIFRYFNSETKVNNDNDLGGSSENLVDSTNLWSPKSTEDNGSDFVMKRHKIGCLPSYIPLS